ncbi:hypothetical protein GH722_18885 [Alphaproteobacteria bacterium HT1-32]|nr:hypothetical protein [Alphaproteobacteria bacterium HT1-32]
MQTDMHYYGTYVLARTAGLRPDICSRIATAAQFVDDNVARSGAEFLDGAHLFVQATAHHPIDLSNVNKEDQRNVWAPFHFLPGNEGAEYTERLKCRKDSAISREMLEHHLQFSDRKFAPELFGITAHVYADTFSHYGFSGVSSRGNRVAQDSIDLKNVSGEIRDYIQTKAESFFEKNGTQGGLFENIRSRFMQFNHSFQSFAAEELSGALGHGGVATFPDRPYLIWSFEYENDELEISERNNQETFLEGCEKIHEYFCRVGGENQEFVDRDCVPFGSIKSVVTQVLQVQKNKDGRIDAWKRAFSDGSLGIEGELIPIYDGIRLNTDWDNLDGTEDHQVALDREVFRFYQAASLHRIFVLRDLLPKHGILVG